MYTKLARLTKVVTERRNERLTSLAHLLTPELLTASFYGLNAKSAPGVDGVTVQDYEKGLDTRIENLHHRLRENKYRAQAVLRKEIPKSGGKVRRLGLPTVEDKVVQGATVEILNRIWEPEFLDFSYGFRRGRGAQQAQDDLGKALQFRPINWVLDVDIKGFFDNLNHEWLRRFLSHRIADKRFLAIIGKWMRADIVEEDGSHTRPDAGVPQGGTVSPVLANIYLHYVFDLWADRRMRKQMRGRIYPYRYADDIVVGFEYEEDARVFLATLHERLSGFGLELHPDKTQLIEFGKRAWGDWRKGIASRPRGFTFLGLTFICRTNLKGLFQIGRITSTKSLRTFKEAISETCRKYRHYRTYLSDRLSRMLLGHYAYFGVSGNSGKLCAAYNHVILTLRKWLNRRGGKQYFSWEIYKGILLKNPLPLPKLVRSPLCRS